MEVVVSDLEALESASLVNLTGSASVLEVTLTENAAAYLNYLQEQAIDPLKRLVGEFWDYLDSEGFQSRHSQAWRKWQSAASLLWAAGDPSDFGNIGFRSRESMKAFVTDLVDMYDPPEVEPDPEKISDRLHDVLEFRQEQLGERSKPFLDALKDYWDKLARRYQLLVHHKTPEAQTLTLNDAKWIVYQTAMVMFEIDRSLSRGA